MVTISLPTILCAVLLMTSKTVNITNKLPLEIEPDAHENDTI